MAAIRMSELTKRYGKDAPAAVERIDLNVDEGEFVVLLGPSGCGKTSTLRMVAGLEAVSDGELWFDDRLVNGDPPEQRNVGMVFQNYALYPHMTVYRNLAFGMQARGTGKAEMASRIGAIGELLGLQDLMARRPKELSGGQRQRVALGRALVRQPTIFLMDEPLSNLDANLREQMRLELARLHRELRITTLYVTHDQGEAMTLADRVVVMNRGRIAQVGDPQEVYWRPADTFVAGFIGSPGMNLWTLPWVDDGDTVCLGGTLWLPRTVLPSLQAIGPDVTIGIRPEHLAPTDGESQVEVVCEVDQIERLGSHTQCYAHLPGGQAGAQKVVARLGADIGVAPGTALHLTAPVGAVNLFDPATGRRADTGVLSPGSAAPGPVPLALVPSAGRSPGAGAPVRQLAPSGAGHGAAPGRARP